MSAQATKQARKPAVRLIFDQQKTCIVPSYIRNAPEVMIGYSAQGTGRLLRQPLAYWTNTVTLPRMQEHFLIRAIHHYAMDFDSPFSEHVYDTEVTSVKFNFCYLHYWLL